MLPSEVASGCTSWSETASFGLLATRPLMKARSSRVCEMSFFFQAEDGIRDYKVTGVQTCALPICRDHAPEHVGRPAGRERDHHGDRAIGIVLRGGRTGSREQTRERGGEDLEHRFLRGSEERRVGEECRSRWSPYHLQKKNKAQSTR